jgi:hypothetical protein
MKFPMQDVEDLCLKYLMNEMEFEERSEFEILIKSDPNLIIEIEMMRKTLSQIKQIPILKTPDSLSAKVEKLAADNSRRKRINQFLYKPVVRYAAVVATVGLSFLIGSVINSNSDGIQQKLSGSANQIMKQRSENASQAWVDKKDVLEIKDYNISSTDMPDSLALKNAKKLRLIEKPLIEKSPTDELLLTKSRKQPK